MAVRLDLRVPPVLSYRERREQLLRADLGRALRALADQEERAIESERRVEVEHVALRALIDAGPPLHELRGRHGDLTIARARAAHERAESERLEAVAVERRADLVRAGEDRRLRDELRREDAGGGVIALDELAARGSRPRRRGVAA